jgi:hypothetical protein
MPKTAKRRPLAPVSICRFLGSSSYDLCLGWVQAVYTRLIQGGHTLGLCAGLSRVTITPEYKYYDLDTSKPRFTHRVVPPNLGFLTAVNRLVIPLIHTANKNNNKVNYLKSYLLLIPVRSRT